MEYYQNLSLEPIVYFDKEEIERVEQWRYIVGYKGYYQVSDKGRIRSLDRTLYFNGLTRKVKGTTLKQRISNSGYLRIGVWSESLHYNQSAHRLVAEAFIPNPENKAHVNHIDGNKLNNNDWNLEWCSHSENMHHAFELGLKEGMKGSKSPMSKLTEEQVKEILKIGKSMKQKDMAEMFNIDRRTIGKIINGQRWTHVTI